MNGLFLSVNGNQTKDQKSEIEIEAVNRPKKEKKKIMGASGSLQLRAEEAPLDIVLEVMRHLDWQSRQRCFSANRRLW